MVSEGSRAEGCKVHGPSLACPDCSKRLDGATNVTGSSQPRPGDFAVCSYCGAYLRFESRPELGDGIAVVRATAADLTELEPVPRRRLERAHRAIVQNRAN